MSKRDIIREIKRDLDGKADYISFKYTTVKEIYDLLKEKDTAIEPIYIENPYTHLPVSYCPKCKEPIDQYITGNPYRKTKYCHYCGQAVKWE